MAEEEAAHGFVPHLLTSVEIKEIQQETTRRIADIQWLEAAVDANAYPNSGLKDDLFRARIRYRSAFCRLFRINDLPEDVLREIFRLATRRGSPPTVRDDMLLRLTWVCRMWREMVVSDATLWNAIWFCDDYPSERSFTWFERAGLTELNLHIEDGSHDRQIMEGLLDRVFTKISQIRVLTVGAEAWQPIQAVLDRLQRVAEQKWPMVMQHLELHYHGYGVPADDSEVLEVVSPVPSFGGIHVHVPSLDRLVLDGVYLNWTESHLTNLTALDLSHLPFTYFPDLSTFRAILHSSPNLCILSLEDVVPQLQEGDSLELAPIHLPNLQMLLCANLSLDHVLFFMCQIHAPNVQDLQLSNLLGEDYTPLLIFLTGRFLEVQILTLIAIEVEPTSSVFRWLRSMHQLEYLRIGSLSPVFLISLIWSPEGLFSTPEPGVVDVVCPRLVTLELNATVDLSQVLNWVDLRASLGCPLTKVYITRPYWRALTREEREVLTRNDWHILEAADVAPEEVQLLLS